MKKLLKWLGNHEVILGFVILFMMGFILISLVYINHYLNVLRQ